MQRLPRYSLRVLFLLTAVVAIWTGATIKWGAYHELVLARLTHQKYEDIQYTPLETVHIKVTPESLRTNQLIRVTVLVTEERDGMLNFEVELTQHLRVRSDRVRHCRTYCRFTIAQNHAVHTEDGIARLQIENQIAVPGDG